MWDLSGFPEEEVRRLGYSIREVLEMKGLFYQGKVRTVIKANFRKKNPGESMPVAPLRAIGYTSAGGAFSTMTETGRPYSLFSWTRPTTWCAPRLSTPSSFKGFEIFCTPPGIWCLPASQEPPS